MRGKRKKVKLRLFWGSIFLVIIFAGGFWLFRSFQSSENIKFAVAQMGTIDHERKVSAIFANQELPVIAPVSGNVQYIGNDGQRFRRGESIAAIQAGGAAPGTQQAQTTAQTISAEMGGLFYHQSDGLESLITTDNLVSMDLSKLLALSSNVKSAVSTAQTGEVIGKLVNNLLPTRAFLELPSIDGLAVGKYLRIKVGTQTFSAKILRKSDTPKGVVVQFFNYIDGSATKRHQNVTWVYQPSTSGLIVPKSALWTKGEELGIFVCSEGVLRFKDVQVLDQDDNQVCIKELPDLPSGIPVVTTPREGLEGLVADIKNI